MGLESLNENLPEISAELVFHDQKLQFRPAFESLKQRYFNEIQKFITTPLIFQKMPENNAKHMHTVSKKHY